MTQADTVSFEVVRVDDLPIRAGILVAGRELAGLVRPGMTLRDERTGRGWTVLTVEFPTPRAAAEGLRILQLARTREGAPAPGATLGT